MSKKFSEQYRECNKTGIAVALIGTPKVWCRKYDCHCKASVCRKDRQ